MSDLFDTLRLKFPIIQIGVKLLCVFHFCAVCVSCEFCTFYASTESRVRKFRVRVYFRVGKRERQRERQRFIFEWRWWVSVFDYSNQKWFHVPERLIPRADCLRKLSRWRFDGNGEHVLLLLHVVLMLVLLLDLFAFDFVP